MNARQTNDPEEALASNFAAAKTGGGLEVWAILAHAVFATFLAGLFYLASKPGGAGPIFVFMQGRLYLGLIALLLVGIGGFTSLLRRPVLQRGRLRSFIFVVVVFGIVNLQFPYPTPHEGHPSATCFELPVAEEWTVFWGGEDSEANRLASFLPDRRYGLDLVLEEGGALFASEGTSLEDWYGFGKDVLAPAKGVVVRVRADQPDQLPRDADRSLPAAGNLVVLETREGEFCFLTHLKAGSLLVQLGDEVAAGQKIAEVGSSGFSPFTPMPHLALHLQDTPEPLGEAIPWRFCGYRVSGDSVERGVPTGGLTKEGQPRGQRVSRE